MHNPMVSVILPVYKVEKYLRRCIESLLAQTYKDFEVILVDDGSPDQCGLICDEYSAKYDFIKTIHQDNQGVSAARNNAALAAKGKYVTFIDPDDFVTSDYIEYLLQLIEKYDCDISAANSIYQYEDKEIKQPKAETASAFYPTAEALSRMNYVFGYGTVVWGKMYKRELVVANPFPVGKRYEDIATSYRIIGDSTGLAHGNKQVYYWTQRVNSFMHNGFSEVQYDGIEAVEAQLAYIEERYPEAIPAAKYRYTAKAVELADILFTAGGGHKHFHKLRKHMNKYAGDVLKDENAKKTIKLRIRAMQLGYYPAKLLFWAHRTLKERRL